MKKLPGVPNVKKQAIKNRTDTPGHPVSKKAQRTAIIKQLKANDHVKEWF